MTRYRVWLEGHGLQDIDPAVIITDVQEQNPDLTIETAQTAGNGLRLLRKSRRSLSVLVRIVIREYDVARRKRVCQRIAAWARDGGKLALNDRPGQYLKVDCDQLPHISSALQWLEEIPIVFTAREDPYWQEDTRAFASASGTSGSATICPIGDKRSVPLEASVVNVGAGTLTAVSITAGGQTMRFTGLAVAPGAAMTISVKDGLLDLPVANRTEDSADELLIPCGEYSTVTFTADQTVSAKFYARGAWI